MKRNSQRGFSLIELIIIVVVLAVITSIAIPTYTSFVERTRRADAQVALLEAAARMEQFFTSNNTYVGAALSSAVSENGFYNLAATTTATTYSITATATGTQASDTDCATFTITQTGQRTATNADCWGN